jgi:hypothetical protein
LIAESPINPELPCPDSGLVVSAALPDAIADMLPGNSAQSVWRGPKCLPIPWLTFTRTLLDR